MKNLFKSKSVAIMALVWLIVIVAIGSSTLTMLFIDNNIFSGNRNYFVSNNELEKMRRFLPAFAGSVRVFRGTG